MAQLRHVSLGLVLLSEPPAPQVCHFKKLLAMSLKTARAWLDAHNYVMADAAIVHGWEQTERILKYLSGDLEGAAVVSASKVCCVSTDNMKYSRTSLVGTPGDRLNAFALSGILINQYHLY